MKKDQQLKGHLDALLLAIVERGPAHGYGIIAALREASNGEFDLPEGTVYPSLHRLERDQLIQSDWETSGGRRRRQYEITTAGIKALKESRREWSTFAVSINSVLGVKFA